MKSAVTAPAFRLWTPTGEPFPGVGASAVGFGKAMTDVDTKWFNKDAWRIESFLKRDKTTQLWVDPSAIKNKKGGNISGVVGYDDMERNIKYRGTTDASLGHISELSYTLPLQAGQQRVKVAVKTSLDKDTYIPKTEVVETKVFWKAMLPMFTTEAMLKQGAKGTDSLNLWVQGELSDDLAYGGMAQYSIADGKLKMWEVGLLNTLHLGESKVLATRFVTRDAKQFEFGVLPPKQEVAGKNVQAYMKVNHDLDKGSTDIAITAETALCKCLDVKARFASDIGFAKIQTAFAAIWNAPNGWRVAASVADPGTAATLGIRFAQGSTPPPL